MGKAKAKWESKRRRTRDEGGDAEETNASQDVQPAQELQIQRPAAVKRRAQAGSSTDQIVTEAAASEPEGADSRRSIESETISAARVADVETHNISIKIGISLIAGFLGEYINGRVESS